MRMVSVETFESSLASLFYDMIIYFRKYYRTFKVKYFRTKISYILI